MTSEWTKEAEEIPNFELNVAFLTQKEYYFGDDNNMEQIADKEHYREPLYIPFSDKNLLVTTHHVADNLQELINYYESVFRLNDKYEKELSNASYFWIRPIIKNLDNGNILASFPWYDTLQEIRYLCNGLINNEEGEIFYDRDQGWEIIVENDDGKLFIKESDPDYNETFCCIWVDRQEMIKQVKTTLEKIELIVNQLANYFGVNYWEKRI
jgi:hypothetical protein